MVGWWRWWAYQDKRARFEAGGIRNIDQRDGAFQFSSFANREGYRYCTGVTHSTIPGVALGLRSDGPLKGETDSTESTNLACWAGSSARKCHAGYGEICMIAVQTPLRKSSQMGGSKRLNFRQVGHPFGASQPLAAYWTRSAPERWKDDTQLARNCSGW